MRGRYAKGALIYHQVEPRVRVHIFVAALGLQFQTLLQHHLDQADVDLSEEHALQALKTVRQMRFAIEGTTRSSVSVANPRGRQVLKALGISELRPPATPVEEPAVM